MHHVLGQREKDGDPKALGKTSSLPRIEEQRPGGVSDNKGVKALSVGGSTWYGTWFQSMYVART